MSDETVTLQHGNGMVPDGSRGYDLDDNARALMATNLAAEVCPAAGESRSLIYASSLQHAWNDEQGRFDNFVHTDHGWVETVGSEDSNGRAFWALGHTAEMSRSGYLRWWAQHWLDKVLPSFHDLSSPRAVAFNVLGACCVLRKRPDHVGAIRLVGDGASMVSYLLDDCRRPDWAWFEAVLGYDNPRLSHALIEAGELRGVSEWLEAGLETLKWICGQQTTRTGQFRPVGSDTLGRSGQIRPFAQQSFEAQAAVEATEAAYRVTGAREWLDHARAAHAWFFGADDLRVALVDSTSGRFQNGNTAHPRHDDCGAQSRRAYQLATYSLRRMHKVAERRHWAVGDVASSN